MQHAGQLQVGAVVRLLDTTCGRIGNGSYAHTNGSYGLTALRKRHADVLGDRITLQFKGKSGVLQHLEVHDARLAGIVRKCRQLPGQTLFSYHDEQHTLHSIGSGDVNAYLHAICGDGFSAKDFRTWHGSAMALAFTAAALRRPGLLSTSKGMLAAVAQALANTAAVCRKSYVHPRLLVFAQLASSDPQRARRQLHRAQARNGGDARAVGRGLRQAERALLTFLRT